MRSLTNKKKMYMSVVMGGAGQVGSAVAQLMKLRGKKVKWCISDPKSGGRPPADDVRFLHVCIPYSDHFVEDVKKEIEFYSPEFIIVHSTVPVGTTRLFGDHAAHAPIRGQHNKLKSDIRKFTMFVGPMSSYTQIVVLHHMRDLGVLCNMMAKPEDTELLKLLCLSRFLNDLAYYENAARLLKENGTDPASLYRWTRTYNDGYRGTIFQRPHLDFPNGVVGGTCVMQNSRFLNDEFTRRNIELFEKKEVQNAAQEKETETTPPEILKEPLEITH
jgi:hypothetical protein